MLLKLLKYDLKSTAMRMLLSFAVFTFVCILMPPVISLFNGDAAILYFTLTVPVGIIALFVITLIFVFQRYSKSLYGSEGYLMFTLPLKGRMLLISKVIITFLWLTVAVVLSIASVATLLFLLSSYSIVQQGIELVRNSDAIHFSEIMLFVVSFILGVLAFIMQVYFSITVSRLSVFRKFGTLVGVLAFFVINYAESIPQLFYEPAKVPTGTNIELSGVGAINLFVSAFSWNTQYITLITMAVLAAGLGVATTVLIEKQTSLK